MQQYKESCNPFIIPQTPEQFNCQYFGKRDNATSTCLQILQKEHILTLSGNSGVGKSSIVHCGIVPELIQNIESQGHQAIHIHFTPGTSPIAILAQKLAKEGILHKEKDAEDIYALTNEENLRNDEEGLINILSQAQGQNLRFIFSIDHLEELFKNPAFYAEEDFTEEISLFLNLFIRLSEHPKIITYTVFVLRSRFMVYSKAVPELNRLFNKGIYILPGFSKNEVQLIADYQLQQCSLVLSSSLKQRLHEDIQDKGYTLHRINHALYRTIEYWKQGSIKENLVDEDYYLRAGGIQHALDKHAEEVFSLIKSEDLEMVAEGIFRLLINAQNLEYPLARVLSIRRISELSGFSVNNVQRIVQHFRHAQCPLLKYSASSAITEDTCLQITDQYMIHAWKRLAHWINNEHTSITIYMWLARSAENYYHREEALYKDPLLSRTLEWRDQERPSKAWAKLYRSNYEEAMRFLNESEEASLQKEQKTKNAYIKRKKKYFYGLLGSILFVALLSLIFGIFKHQQAAETEAQARANKKRSLANNLVFLSRDFMGKDPTLALRLAQKAKKMNDARHIRNTIRRIYSENNFYQLITELPGEVRSLKLSPNEKFLVASSGNKAYLLDINGRRLNVLDAHTRPINSVDISKDGKHILTGSIDQTTRIWNLNGESLHVMHKHSDAVEACRFSPGNRFIVTAGRDGKVLLWDKQGDFIRTIDAIKGDAYDARFSPDGEFILAGFDNYQARLYNLKGRQIRAFRHQWDRVHVVNFSNNGKQILTAGRYKFFLWNRNGKKLRKFAGHSNYINELLFSPDGRYIISASSDKTIKLWNKQGRALQEFLGHSHRVRGADLFKNGQKIITGSKDNTIRMWKVDYNKVLVYSGHKDVVASIAPSPGGLSFLSGSWDHTARLFHPLTGTKTTLSGHKDDISRAVFVDNGHKIVTAADDGKVILWNKEGRILNEYQAHQQPISGVAVSPDGKRFATSSWDNTARLWTWEGELLQTFTGHKGSVYDVAFSPDGKHICTASRDQTARMWEINGNLTHIFRAHTARIADVEFSPKGRYILTASWDNTAILWDISGHIVQRMKGHENYVNAADFSHDGQFIVTASFDNTAKLWDLKGNELQSFKGHDDFVMDATFSMEDKFVLTASSDQTTRVWKIKRPLQTFFKQNKIKELTKFQLFKYNIIHINELLQTAGENELLKGAAYCMNNSLNYQNPVTKNQWLQKSIRLYKKAYTFYHRNSIKEKLAHIYGMQIKNYLFLQEFNNALKAFQQGTKNNSGEKLLLRYEPLVYLLNNKPDIAKEVYRERMYEPYDEVLKYKTLFVSDIKSLKNADVTHKHFDEILTFLTK